MSILKREVVTKKIMRGYATAPWKISVYPDGDDCVATKEGTYIARLFNQDNYLGDGVSQANAELIAAAPELFEALDSVISQIKDIRSWDDSLDTSIVLLERLKGERDGLCD